jgi:hypothetical protein
MKYFKEATYLWETFVPSRGQADTVQGELIRAIEKLRDEARRNGNMNWDKGHEILANYIKNVLTGSDVFTPTAKDEISADIGELLDFNDPKTEEEIYDRISDRIVEWYLEHREPIPHKNNPDLWR